MRMLMLMRMLVGKKIIILMLCVLAEFEYESDRQGYAEASRVRTSKSSLATPHFGVYWACAGYWKRWRIEWG